MRIIECEQGSPEWFAIRRGIPTASDFDSIVTPARGDLSASADKLINRLIDEIVRGENAAIAFRGNVHTARGKELEPEARALYSFMTGRKVETVGFCLSDCGRFGCSPDGLTDEGGLEIKCPDGPTHVSYLRAGIVPKEYRPQVAANMIVTGRRHWDFVSYCPGHRPFIVRETWNPYTDKVSESLYLFLDQFEFAKRGVLP